MFEAVAISAVFFNSYTFGTTFFCHIVQLNSLKLALDILATAAAMRLTIQFSQQSLKVYELANKASNSMLFMSLVLSHHLFYGAVALLRFGALILQSAHIL